MVICVFTTKGGVGKTSLSFSLAKDLGYDLITNDFSSAVTNFSGGSKGKARYYKSNLPFRDGTLYDFGGFEDANAYEIIEKADVLIVPTIDDFNAMMKCMDILKKFKHKQILVVANAIEKKTSFENVKMILNQYFPDLKIFPISRTKMFKNALDSRKSATELYKENNVYDRGFKGYLSLLHEIKSFEQTAA